MYGASARNASDGARETILTREGHVSGLGWLPDGRLLVVAMQDQKLLRVEADGAVVLHADLSGVATGLSWLCYFRALQLGEASRVAPIDKLSVVVAIALAAIFLHEHLTWHHWVGGSLIFAGAVVIAYA